MSAAEMFKIRIAFTLTRAVDRDKLLFFPEMAPSTILSMGGLGLLLKHGVVAEPFRLPRLAWIPPRHLDRFKAVAVKLKEAYFLTKEVNIITFRRKWQVKDTHMAEDWRELKADLEDETPQIF